MQLWQNLFFNKVTGLSQETQIDLIRGEFRTPIKQFNGTFCKIVDS